MSKSLRNFFNRRSVKYFAFAIISYFLFIVIGIKAISYISPSDLKFWENIVPIAGLFFSGILGFILDKEKEQGLKLYEKKIEACQDFLKVLEDVIEGGIILLNRDITSKKDELNKIFFAVSKLRMHFEEKDILEIIGKCTDISDALNERRKNNKNEKDYYQKLSSALFGISKIFKELLEQLKPEGQKENLKEPNQFVIAIDEFILNVIQPTDQSHVSENTWHVNVGEDYNIADPKDQYRCWQDMLNFGFWSAGGAKRYADGTKKLKEGDTIYAYLSGKGYIARGDVKEKAKLVRDFFSGKDKNKIISKSFLEHLNDKSFEGFHNADIGEYAVKVEWNFKNPPVTNSDLHISPMTICKMNQANLAILEREFQTKKGEIKK